MPYFMMSVLNQGMHAMAVSLGISLDDLMLSLDYLRQRDYL
jgi:hypothetical protein